jgi:hypothetical protein
MQVTTGYPTIVTHPGVTGNSMASPIITVLTLSSLAMILTTVIATAITYHLMMKALRSSSNKQPLDNRAIIARMTDDELLERAVRVVTRAQKATAGLLWAKLGISLEKAQ